MNNETWKEERDTRQYERMRTQLRHFSDGQLDLGGLIGDLDFLINELEYSDDSWVKRFHAEWEKLELIYALSLDAKERGKSGQLGQNDLREISNVVDALMKLVNEKVSPSSE